LPPAGIKAEDRHLKSNKISDNSERDLSKHPKELTDVVAMVALELAVWDYRRSTNWRTPRLQICGGF